MPGCFATASRQQTQVQALMISRSLYLTVYKWGGPNHPCFLCCFRNSTRYYCIPPAHPATSTFIRNKNAPRGLGVPLLRGHTQHNSINRSLCWWLYWLHRWHHEDKNTTNNTGNAARNTSHLPPPHRHHRTQWGDPILEKKLDKLKGLWLCVKEILGWFIDGTNYTLYLPDKKWTKSKSNLDGYWNDRACLLKSFTR